MLKSRQAADHDNVKPMTMAAKDSTVPAVAGVETKFKADLSEVPAVSTIGFKDQGQFPVPLTHDMMSMKDKPEYAHNTIKANVTGM